MANLDLAAPSTFCPIPRFSFPFAGLQAQPQPVTKLVPYTIGSRVVPSSYNTGEGDVRVFSFGDTSGDTRHLPRRSVGRIARFRPDFDAEGWPSALHLLALTTELRRSVNSGAQKVIDIEGAVDSFVRLLRDIQPKNPEEA